MDEDEARGFAGQLKHVLQRCLAPDRVMDVKRKRMDHDGPTVADCYYVSLWVGDREKRTEYRERKAARGRRGSRKSWGDSLQEGCSCSKRKWLGVEE